MANDLETIPLDPDEGKLRQLFQMGLLHVMTLRRAGVLVGYSAFIVSPHLHYRSTLFALNDVIYVSPRERGIAGMKLVRAAERDLFERGVKKIIYHAKIQHPQLARLLSRLGYSKIEENFAKTVT